MQPLWLNRKQESDYYTAMAVMRESGDITYVVKYFRMTPEKFDFLHSLLQVDLEKQYVCRETISSAERLALTLRQ